MQREPEPEPPQPFSENAEEPAPGSHDSYFARKHSNAVKYTKFFKNCYFYINDISQSYREYFEACEGRCCVSVVSFRNRLIDIILKRGGSIEVALSPYVTHFIVERPNASSRWWVYRRMKGAPKQYQFITAKYLVECHLKGKRLQERSYFPKFLHSPSLYSHLPQSNETTPKREEEARMTPNSRVGAFRFLQTWSQIVEAEGLEDFESMDTGISMNGFILYLYLENFLVETIMGTDLDCPAAVCRYGQIIAFNPHAKTLGLKRGINIEAALEKCTHLKLAKYDYDKVTARGLEVLRLLKRYTTRILSPFYNEFYLQVSYPLCRTLLEDPGPNGNENICRLTDKISKSLPTQCVIGIGKNMPIAKLASKMCRNLRINSQESDYDYELSPLLSIAGTDGVLSFASENICLVNDGFKFINSVFLSEIPGVGMLWPVLKSRGLVTCNDVLKRGSPLCLQSILGGRIGKMVYNFCFGYDYRCANLPKNQLDFFLGKSFVSSITIDSSTPGEISSNVSVYEEAMRDIQSLDMEGFDPFSTKKDSSRQEDSTEVQTQPEEDVVLRNLLANILKQVCSVYSLFDKCIINYSIKYKCTVLLTLNTDTSLSALLTSILDKQPLRHAIQALYRRIREELGVEFAQIRGIQLMVKDIIRAEVNAKFIDKFLTDRSPSRLRSSESLSDSEDLRAGAPSSRENVATPTRRLNGWRVDSSDQGSSARKNRRSGPRRGSKSPGRPRTKSPRPHLSLRSNLDSSVESHTKSPSRARSILLAGGQKCITEYLSPSKLQDA